uniref:Uncharacterized protein n=1 Tax=Utricularia reniformis TaxID=192314 RepID=A0A1Y0B126_9LAMI|nr:hypothetical protein AEK19_MT0850 [Utricularia reniformis]YP_009382287.1 hypothetical protein AEK19_MT1859 [Utricularia reniformis]ART31081.1 hypothetical protein AEK19_MT0850 [Utricularia reniformis]ART32030.1 hypothetical protein AEK19_MT1859 [Utricularia reniformis]
MFDLIWSLRSFIAFRKIRSNLGIEFLFLNPCHLHNVNRKVHFSARTKELSSALNGRDKSRSRLRTLLHSASTVASCRRLEP